MSDAMLPVELSAKKTIAVKEERPRRVAVIGVHGIARHPAGETENAMANLLLSLPAQGSTLEDGERRYEAFRAVGIQIPLQRVCCGTPPPAKKKGMFKERSTEFAETLRETDGAAQDVGNSYTEVLLEDYRGGADSNVYVTTRLEGERKASGGKNSRDGAAKVDIYEVLWADLAHPDSSFVGFFLSLFSLLLHLGSLSRLVLDSGAGENPGKLWTAYRTVQAWAVNMLQIFVPLFKVLLLVVVLAAIPGVADALKANKWLTDVLSNPDLKSIFERNKGLTEVLSGNSVLAVGLGLLAGTAIGFYFFSKVGWIRGRSPWIWAVVVMMPGIAGILLASAFVWIMKPEAAASLAAWVFVGAPIVYLLLNNYEEYRNGALASGWTAYVLSLAVYVALLIETGKDVAKASFWLTELVVAAIRVSWLSLCLLAMIAFGLGVIANRRKQDPDMCARTRAAVRTSRFALAIPSVLLLLVTPILWAAMFWLADRVNHTFFDLSQLSNDGLGGLLQWLERVQFIPKFADMNLTKNVFKSLVAWGLGYQLPLTLLLVAMGVFLLAFWALPSALLERFPLRGKKEPPRSSTDKKSLGLGRWLSRGLDGTAVVTGLFWSAVFLSFPAVYLMGIFTPKWVIPLKWATEWFVDHPLSAMAGAAAVALAKYGSSALETVLDVDTYLRTSPEDASPRAKIFERYVSTLRYIARHRDGEGVGYDSVVIVAHSLGSLISADLLRFLYAKKNDSALACFEFGVEDRTDKIPVTLLTMGSPIRQLLNRFFPYLYSWARERPDNGLEPLPESLDKAPHQINMHSPDPAELGLQLWMNMYRSGDYVGRSLWLDEWYKRPGEAPAGSPTQVKSSDGSRVEMCIGAGAHTHYWDDTAPDVARALDSLI